MIVSFLDLKAPYLELKSEIDNAYQRVMESGWYILGEEVEAFEEEFANYSSVKHCIGVGNGLEALHLILRGYEIGPGDEVIVPANTYIATWLAVSYAGATPVPVEPDPRTFNIDPLRIEDAITEHTRAILLVHLYGQMADMSPILDIAHRFHLRVFEDAAQAQGARYRGNMPGVLSDAAGTSFYPTKNLGAVGDGGAILTNDDDLAERVYVLRNYGSRVKYVNKVKGFNSRLDPLQAAILRVKLSHLDLWNRRRNEIAATYLENLYGSADLTLPFVPEWATPIWHQFVIRLNQRDALREYLSKAGIATLIHYPIPPHLSEAYIDMGRKSGDFPITERMADTVLSLPIGPHLKQDETEYIVEAVNHFLSRNL
jgi:dTDP-4-amino-4,6-dideoxygalactose transaminase